MHRKFGICILHNNTDVNGSKFEFHDTIADTHRNSTLKPARTSVVDLLLGKIDMEGLEIQKWIEVRHE